MRPARSLGVRRVPSCTRARAGAHEPGGPRRDRRHRGVGRARVRGHRLERHPLDEGRPANGCRGRARPRPARRPRGGLPRPGRRDAADAARDRRRAVHPGRAARARVRTGPPAPRPRRLPRPGGAPHAGGTARPGPPRPRGAAGERRGIAGPAAPPRRAHLPGRRRRRHHRLDARGGGPRHPFGGRHRACRGGRGPHAQARPGDLPASW